MQAKKSHFGSENNARPKRHRSDPFYNSWTNMRQRCANKNRPDYRFYGGRGITFCDEWKLFENFERDMWATWRRGLELDRINNDSNYCKKNCRWATRSQQMRNNNRTVFFIINGERVCRSELMERTGMDRMTLTYRLATWPIGKALNHAVRKRGH